MVHTSDELRHLARTLTPIEDGRFSIAVLHEADHVARDEPAALTDVHIRHIACYQPDRVLELVQKRAAAIERRADEAFKAANALATKSAAVVAPPPVPREPFPREGSFKEMLAWFVKHQPDAPASMGHFAHLCTFTLDMNERNKERNAQIATLEERTAAAEARTVALEQKCATLETRLAFETRLAALEAQIEDRVRR